MRGRQVRDLKLLSGCSWNPVACSLSPLPCHCIPQTIPIPYDLAVALSRRMVFCYQRVVRFQDTDAAGVVYFANVLAMCHEGYEASLAAAGVDLNDFFRGTEVAVPVVHASVNFFQPLYCGDRLNIYLTPTLLNTSEFEIAFEVFLAGRSDKAASKAQTRHVCIDPNRRSRMTLPDPLRNWLHDLSAASFD